MALYADAAVGKSANELLTKKYSYDQKVSIESKTDNGIKFTCTGTKKGSTSGDVKASYAFKDGLDFETVVTDSGSISSKIEARDVLAPGLKTSATGHYTEPNNSKLEAEYKKSPVGVKASVQGINSKPKVSGSACFSYKGFSVGGDATMAPSKDGVNVGAYSAGAEYSADKSTVALVADDKFDKVQMRFKQDVNSDVSLGGEFKRKMSEQSNLVSLGVSSKVENNGLVKAAVNSNGTIDVLYSAQLDKKTSFTVCSQMDAKQPSSGGKVGAHLEFKS